MFACSLRAPGRPTRPQSTVNSLPQFCEVRPRAHLVKVVRRQRRRNELRRVAARRVGWRRTARPKGSQEQCPKPGQQLSPIHCPNLRPMLGPARRENRFRFSRPKNSRSPKLAPVLRPVSASLRLRCRFAAFPAPATILAELAKRQPAEYAHSRGRATDFLRTTLFFFRAPARFIYIRLTAEIAESLL